MESSRHSRGDDESRDSGRRRHRSKSRSRSRDRDRHHKKHRASSPTASSSTSSSRHKDSRGDKDRDRHRSNSSSHKSERDRSHRHDKDREQRRDRHKEKKQKRSSREGSQDEAGVEDDEDMWVEKEVPEAVALAATSTTISTTLVAGGDGQNATSAAPEVSSSGRAAWMLEEGGGLEFAMMGVEKQKKPKEEKPDPEKLQVSSRELNVHLKAGLSVDQYPEQEKKSYTIGDAGSNWRMTKLRRVLETAAEEGVAPQVIGIERYGSLEKFNEALEERKELDRRKAERDNRKHDRNRDDRRDRDGHRDSKSNRDRDSGRDRDRDRDSSGRDSPMSGSGRYSGYNSAASSPFHRPMEPHERQERELARRAMEKERERKTSTPIPSPFATIVSSPMVHSPNPTAGIGAEPSADSSSTASTRALSQDELNKLKAKALRAKLMGTPDASQLEKEYEAAEQAFKEASVNPPQRQQQNQQSQDARVVVVQTLQHSSSGSASPAHGQTPAKKRAYGKGKETTHDAQGNRTAYEGEEGDVALHDLVLRERLERDTGGMDREYARRITRDAKFQDDVDYLDENVDKIARTVKRTDRQLKDAAVNDYKRTQGALDSCQACFKDDGRTAPVVPVVSLGTRVYLGLPLVKEFLPGQCQIVPLQHVTSTLELDDDAWDEIRNFMKCLIQMHAAQDRFVVFSETVLHRGGRRGAAPRHTVIECYPIPWQAGQAASGYFKEAILGVAEEWSQHKKIIETNAKDPQIGGIRRRLTSKLPYFHVWCFGNPDRGYGHVIEDDESSFPDYFVREVLASACEMDSWEWQRKPKRLPAEDNERRLREFKRTWQPWDWTRTLEKQ